MLLGYECVIFSLSLPIELILSLSNTPPFNLSLSVLSSLTISHTQAHFFSFNLKSTCLYVSLFQSQASLFMPLSYLTLLNCLSFSSYVYLNISSSLSLSIYVIVFSSLTLSVSLFLSIYQLIYLCPPLSYVIHFLSLVVFPSLSLCLSVSLSLSLSLSLIVFHSIYTISFS